MDEYFRVLSNPYRRRLLVYLYQNEPNLNSPVSEAVFEGEGDLKEIKIELFQWHLPYLEDLGLIEWDPNTHRVEKGPAFNDIQPFIDLILDLDEGLQKF